MKNRLTPQSGVSGIFARAAKEPATSVPNPSVIAPRYTRSAMHKQRMADLFFSPMIFQTSGGK